MGAIATEVDAGVDKTAALVSATLVCGCGAAATGAIVSAVELNTEDCAIELEIVVASAGVVTATGAAVVASTGDVSGTCASEVEAGVDSGEGVDEKTDDDDDGGRDEE